MQSTHYSCQILMKLESARDIFEKNFVSISPPSLAYDIPTHIILLHLIILIISGNENHIKVHF